MFKQLYKYRLEVIIIVVYLAIVLSVFLFVLQ